MKIINKFLFNKINCFQSKKLKVISKFNKINQNKLKSLINYFNPIINNNSINNKMPFLEEIKKKIQIICLIKIINLPLIKINQML